MSSRDPLLLNRSLYQEMLCMKQLLGETAVSNADFFYTVSIQNKNWVSYQATHSLHQDGEMKEIHVGYTGCNRRNGPDFGRMFLMLNYTEKPQNTYIQS